MLGPKNFPVVATIKQTVSEDSNDYVAYQQTSTKYFYRPPHFTVYELNYNKGKLISLGIYSAVTGRMIIKPR